jgi:hypothetical protein
MAAGRVVFGSDNTRPDIIPDPYTNIHIHQVNRVKKWTVPVPTGYPSGIGYPVDGRRSQPRRRSSTARGSVQRGSGMKIEA